MNQFYDVIAAEYDRRWGDQEYADDEVAFLRGLAGAGPALEVGIGTGRVAIPLAENGVRVVGVDPSPRMLQVLTEKLRRLPHLRVEGGPGSLALSGTAGTFSLVYCVFHTLFYADSRAEQRLFFRRAAELLEPHGCVVVEGYNPGPARRARWAKGIRVSEVWEHGYEYELYRHDEANQIVHIGCNTCVDDKVRYAYWAERYLTPVQIDDLAAEAGLALRERWSSFARDPFDASSRRCVSVYGRVAPGE